MKGVNPTDPLSKLYLSYYGTAPDSISKLPGAGSNRVYYRLQGSSGSCIGVKGTMVEENRAFLYLARHFRKYGFPVPQVYVGGKKECLAAGLSMEDAELFYLQEDLGDCSLFQVLEQRRSQGGQYTEPELSLLRKTIAMLPRLQYEGANELDFNHCFPQKAFDRQTVFFDLNYFKYCFLKGTGLEFNEMDLEADFHRLADDLFKEDSNTFLYRDFQSRNVMIKNDSPYFIDFQGGRRGPIYYDLASFLWQAKVAYSAELKKELIGVYLEALRPYRTIDSVEFCRALNRFVLLRTLQVLGAYGFRGLMERKAHFLQSIPFAVSNLLELLDNGVADPYPVLKNTLYQMCRLPRFSPSDLHVENKGLVVRIFSFSYKNGIPEDESGNGGGYVFDCRSTHNPGRYEPYKKLTGMDEPVIRFLEEDGEISSFLDSVYKLADAHVTRYLERGFSDLMFAFGCTGGQHRSVYSAEHLAAYLHRRYGIEIRLFHREQNVRKRWEAANK